MIHRISYVSFKAVFSYTIIICYIKTVKQSFGDAGCTSIHNRTNVHLTFRNNINLADLAIASIYIKWKATSTTFTDINPCNAFNQTHK